MRLQPLEEDQQITAAATALLEENEVIVPTKVTKQNSTEVQKIFNNAGASIEEIAEQTANLMRGAETDAGRLGALKFAAEIHKIVDKEIDTKKSPEINIQIVTNGQVNLLNLMMPASQG
jgi:hypothetical protein